MEGWPERAARGPTTPEGSGGLSMMDVLALSDSERRLVNWMVRTGEVGLADAIAFLAGEEPVIRSLLAGLVERGYVAETLSGEQTRYRVALSARRTGRGLPSRLWKALDDKADE